MTIGHAHNFFDHAFTIHLVKRNILDRLRDESIGILSLEKTNLEYLHICKGAGPIRPYLAKGLYSTEEQCQPGMILCEATEPVEQEFEIQVVLFPSPVQFFELIEHHQHLLFALQRLL